MDLTTTALSQSLDTSEDCLMINNEECTLVSVNRIYHLWEYELY